MLAGQSTVLHCVVRRVRPIVTLEPVDRNRFEHTREPIGGHDARAVVTPWMRDDARSSSRMRRVNHLFKRRVDAQILAELDRQLMGSHEATRVSVLDRR